MWIAETISSHESYRSERQALDGVRSCLHQTLPRLFEDTYQTGGREIRAFFGSARSRRSAGECGYYAVALGWVYRAEDFPEGLF